MGMISVNAERFIGRFITSTAKNEHLITDSCCCMKISVHRRLARRIKRVEYKKYFTPPNFRNRCVLVPFAFKQGPLHAIQIQFVHIRSERFSRIFIPTEDVHCVTKNATTVAIPGSRNQSTDSGTSPFQSLCVEYIQGITWHVIVSASKKIHLDRKRKR